MLKPPQQVSKALFLLSLKKAPVPCAVLYGFSSRSAQGCTGPWVFHGQAHGDEQEKKWWLMRSSTVLTWGKALGNIINSTGSSLAANCGVRHRRKARLGADIHQQGEL